MLASISPFQFRLKFSHFNFKLITFFCENKKNILFSLKHCYKFSYICLQSLSEGFPELEELSVAGVNGDISSRPVIDDDSLLRILKNSNKLRLLDVRGCSRLTDSSLVRVPAWDLEHLFLSGWIRI